MMEPVHPVWAEVVAARKADAAEAAAEPTPQPAPAPAPKAPPSSIPPTYHAFLTLPLAERNALRENSADAVAALRDEHYRRNPNLRPPDTTAPAPAPEAAPLPADAFQDYRAFLAASRVVRDAFRAAHPGIVSMWQASFNAQTRVKVGLS